MAGEERNPDAKLTAAIVQARGWFAGLRSGRYESLRGLANETGLDRSDIGRRIRLAFLAPDIVEAILEGRQPADLNLTRLKQLGQLPLAWADQRSLLSFSS
jgi:site-specific DNA recombinase